MTPWWLWGVLLVSNVLAVWLGLESRRRVVAERARRRAVERLIRLVRATPHLSGLAMYPCWCGRMLLVANETCLERFTRVEHTFGRCQPVLERVP